MVTGVNLVTVGQFEQFIARPENRERVFELIDGEIVEKVPTHEHGILIITMGAIFLEWLEANAIGHVATDVRHRPAGDERNERRPDISVVLGDKPVERRGPVNYMPDVCVEIQSPDDPVREMRAKADFYLQHGARMVILVFPSKRLLEVITLNDDYFLNEADTLEGGEILPGFSVPVSRLFRRL